MAPSLVVQKQVALAPLHTFASDGWAQAVVTLASLDQLIDLSAAYAQWAKPVWILGAGSNVVFADDFPGTLVLNRLRGRECLHENTADGTAVWRVSAGENWHEWVAASIAAGWSGIENLALIPGTVGAAPIQNIGAYGVELSQVCVGVTAWHVPTGTTQYFDAKDCAFAYRDSFFKQPEARHQWIILSVDFRLSRHFQAQQHYPALANFPEPLDTPQAVFDAVCQIRQSKLPNPEVLPNAGSFFKNPIVSKAQADKLRDRLPSLPIYPVAAAAPTAETPPPEQVKLSAAYLIEQAGLKGLNWQEVGVYSKHALVLVRHHAGSGHALLGLAQHIQTVVAERFGVTLEPEPIVWPSLTQ